MIQDHGRDEDARRDPEARVEVLTADEFPDLQVVVLHGCTRYKGKLKKIPPFVGGIFISGFDDYAFTFLLALASSGFPPRWNLIFSFSLSRSATRTSPFLICL